VEQHLYYTIHVPQKKKKSFFKLTNFNIFERGGTCFAQSSMIQCDCKIFVGN
jgi:hypothetical protein